MTHWSNALLDSRHPRTLQLHPLHMTRHPEWKPNGFIYIKRHEGSRLLSIVPYVQHCSPAVHFRLFSPRPPMTHINLQKCDGLRRPSDERVLILTETVRSFLSHITQGWNTHAVRGTCMTHAVYIKQWRVCLHAMYANVCFLFSFVVFVSQFKILDIFPAFGSVMWKQAFCSAAVRSGALGSLIRLDGTAGRRQATGEP